MTAGLTANGVLGKTDIDAKVFDKNTITVDMFGYVFYRQFRYKMVTHARVFSLKPKFNISERQGLFLANSLCFLSKKFGFDNMCSWSKIKSEEIQLPLYKGKIDFVFMEGFIAELEAQRIAELEAYLSAAGLKDFELTLEEEQVLESFNHGELVFADFAFSTVFNRIVQGRRLKKDDQVSGNIPFVMAGITNTGVVNYISNPVSSFPQNSITIDIFGNTFYRNYSFGAGDDTGVYWHDKRIYSKETMLFFTAAMSKSLYGKFSFGNKLRSSQSLNFNMSLPAKDHEPDVALMQTFISAVQKLVIKDVVHYADQKIAATNQVVQRH